MKYKEMKKTTKYEVQRNEEMRRFSNLQTSDFRLQKGVSIYLALMIMSILLAIGLGISLIIVSQMKTIKGMGDSVVAFYAADTGIERALYEPMPSFGGDVGDASYTVEVVCCCRGVGDCLFGVGECAGYGLEEDLDCVCNAFYLCYTSVGTYRGIRRAIESTR